MEAIVLLTVGAIPTVAVPIRHHSILVAEPAVDRRVCGFLPAKAKRRRLCRRDVPGELRDKNAAETRFSHTFL